MKEKYEKPVIETENFTVEMMQAPCTVGPDDTQYLTSYVSFSGYNCSCTTTNYGSS